MASACLVIIAVVLRVLIAVCTRTFFQPDEYFQALEPAHAIVFGYGHLTWEWLSERPIRSIVYPALNVPVYWVLKVLHLDDTELLVLAPKVLHGVLAAGTDIWLSELTRKVLGERYVLTAYFLSLTSLFNALSLSRSLSNSLETTLTIIALSYYPWSAESIVNRTQLRKLLVFAALACVVRTTNVIIWVLAISALLWRLQSHHGAIASFVMDALLVGACTLFTLFALDSFYYHRPTLTPLSFLLTNASPVSLFYGSAPWHYYLTQALPILSGTALPFVLHGLWRTFRPLGPQVPSSPKLLLGLVIWTTCAYSLIGHKEWRFLHPMLPLLHVFAAKSLVDLYHAHTTSSPRRSSTHRQRKPRLPIRSGHLALLLLAVPASVYVCLYHSHAQISVMRYLHYLPDEELKSVGFLMPCHSTPGQAYLHRPMEDAEGRIWALGCEPPLEGQNITMYKDQTDIFYASPLAYLHDHFPPHVDPAFPPSPYPRTPPGTRMRNVGVWRHEWPSHLVFFGALLGSEGVEETLKHLEYREVWRGGNGLEEDWRRRGGVRVWVYVQPTEKIRLG
ncbi:glycosyltransferase family 22 protein [Dentipellis sp. KUC8613]|nr:glycosyltransferase family 22 protein [Dentipellis sp. KUC8613]